MDKQQQVNQIAKQLGRTLIDNGIKILKSAFHLSPVVYSANEIRNFLGQFNFPSISLADEKYYVVSFSDWQNIIEQDWVGEHQYMADKFDCDNFGYAFSSYASYVFDLNTAGVCFGQVYNKDTGAFIAGHAFNLIIALENGNLVAYLYEPMTRKSIKWEKDKKNILGNFEYRINWVIYY